MNITRIPGFVALKANADKSETPTAIKHAAEQFEMLFAHQMLEAMQKDLEGGSLFGGGVEGNTLGAMAQWELAGKLAGSLDLGIEEQLQAHLARGKESHES